MNRSVPDRIAKQLMILGLLMLPLWGQEQKRACIQILEDADKAYELGSFTKSIELIQACLEKGLNGAQLERARVLMINSLLMLDEETAALNQTHLLLASNPDFRANFTQSQRFKNLIASVRRQRQMNMISSVSGISEQISQVPGTVMVLDAHQLQRRGYRDLVEMLHDLPGFSLTRGNGEEYTNIYPRGMRANSNSGMLLRIDGIEQNDIYANTMYLSRQYPITNVARVVVIYGPVSTLYGPNAYLGVIDVTTLHSFQNYDQKLAASAQLLIGDFATRSGELALGGTFGETSWRVLMRGYFSDEQDLSKGSLGLWDFVANPDNPNPNLGTFSDETQDTYISARFHHARFNVTLESWQRNEGNAPWYSDNHINDGQNNRWSPAHDTLAFDYIYPMKANRKLIFSGRYRQHKIQSKNSKTYLENANIRNYSQISTQAKAGAKFISRGSRLDLIMGLEYRLTNLPAGIYVNNENRHLIKPLIFEGRNEFNDQELGLNAQLTFKLRPSINLIAAGRYDNSKTVNDAIFSFGSNFSPRLGIIHDGFFTTKLLYTQAYRSPSVDEAVADIRRVNFRNNIGNVPRREAKNLELNLLFQRKRFDAQLALYTTRYDETDQFNFEIANQRDNNKNQTDENPAFANQTRNLGGFIHATWRNEPHEISGNLSFVDTNYQGIPVNLSFLDNQPQPTVDNVPVGDIAKVNLNLIHHWTFPRFALALNTRFNHVGSRQTGVGTSVESNPLSKIDPYNLVHMTLSWKPAFKSKQFELQLIARNLLDENYSHPGVYFADALGQGETETQYFASQIPQPGRNLSFSLKYRF